MRLRVLYHGNCFDGCSSAGVFTRFYRERIAKGPLDVALPAARAQGGRAAVRRRLLRRRRERLRRLPLLAGPAPHLVVRPPRLGVPAARRRGPLPRRRHRPQVLRSQGQELHQVPGRHRRRQVRLRHGAARRADSLGRDHRRRALPGRQDGGRAEGAGAAPHDLHREQSGSRAGGDVHRRSHQPAAGRDRRRPVRDGPARGPPRPAPAQHRGRSRRRQAGKGRGLLRPG